MLLSPHEHHSHRRLCCMGPTLLLGIPVAWPSRLCYHFTHSLVSPFLSLFWMTFSAHILSSRGRGLARSLLVPPTLDPQVISAGCWLPVHLALRSPGFCLQPCLPSDRHMRPCLPGSNPTPNPLALMSASATSFSANANYDLPELSSPLLQRQVLFKISRPNVCHDLYCSHPTGSVASSSQTLQQPPAAFRPASTRPSPARAHQPERSFKSVISLSFSSFPKLPRVSHLTGACGALPHLLHSPEHPQPFTGLQPPGLVVGPPAAELCLPQCLYICHLPFWCSSLSVT